MSYSIRAYIYTVLRFSAYENFVVLVQKIRYHPFSVPGLSA